MTQLNSVQVLRDSEFDPKIAQSKGLTLVDFWAEWCGPCKQLAPTIESIAKKFQGSVQVFKMDVDENPITPAGFQIRGIPTLILFKDGQPIEQIVGAHPEKKISETIERHLG